MTDTAQLERVAKAIERELDVSELVETSPSHARHLKAQRVARAAIAAMQEPPPPPKPSEEAMRRASEFIGAMRHMFSDEIGDKEFEEIRLNLARRFDRVAEGERKACAEIAGKREIKVQTSISLHGKVLRPNEVGISNSDEAVCLALTATSAILARTGCPKGGAA